MWTPWVVTGVALAVSVAADRAKTFRGVLQGLRMLLGLLPAIAGMLGAVALVMAALSPETIAATLGGQGQGTTSFVAALGIGSVALIPAFIAYPLAATLRASGASTAVLAAFITTLMMVGVITLPVEARFLGWRVALLRNALAFIGAALVAFGMAAVLR